MDQKRRNFIKATALTAASGILSPEAFFASPAGSKTIRVMVWDERSPDQKEGYENFLGNCIVDQLRKNPAFKVVSAGLDDADKGVSDKALEDTDVLIWWGHVRQNEIPPEKGKYIVQRIISGSLSLIALHSAHWSTPFVESMNEISVRRALGDGPANREDVSFVPPPQQYTVPRLDTRITPYTVEHRFPDGHRKIEMHLPYCCFPAYRNDGKPATLKVLKPGHPVLKGIPGTFQIAQTEMYNEPFHVPEPDQVLLEECWETGEWFRSAMLWQLGKGKIFYFRPGHETYPVYKQQWPLQIISNAARWMAT